MLVSKVGALRDDKGGWLPGQRPDQLPVGNHTLVDGFTIPPRAVPKWIESLSGGGARLVITVALATNSPYLVRSFAGAKEVGLPSSLVARPVAHLPTSTVDPVKRKGPMMAFEIQGVQAIEVLDSRGRPTLMVTTTLSDGTVAEAGVPSGASTGTREAVELRDGDPTRFGGAGVSKAVGHVNSEINAGLAGRSWSDLAEVDQAMRDLDGTPNKARLGANAIIGTSMALARALSVSAGKPLYEWLPGIGQTPRLPVPCFNVLNGGAHAPNPLDFQEFMVCPIGATSMKEAVRAGAEVYQALRKRLVAGGHATGLGDEGGFAPNLAEPEEVLALIVEAIGDAGYPTGRSGVAIALDPAASEFHKNGAYVVNGVSLSSADMIARYAEMIDRFPIWSIEDGLGESDSAGWKQLTETLGDRLQLVGDDNFCTNPAIITAAIADGIANAALIKVNQIGTVTETLEAMQICHEAGYGQMVSHRSGETPDTFIADLAVATGCGQIKTGAPARGERVAKYNRLIQIEAQRPDLPYGLGS